MAEEDALENLAMTEPGELTSHELARRAGAMLLLSKQIHHEAAESLYRLATFDFRSIQTFFRFVDRLPVGKRQIRRLGLNCRPCTDLGMDQWKTYILWDCVLQTIIATKCTNLRSLTFSILEQDHPGSCPLRKFSL